MTNRGGVVDGDTRMGPRVLAALSTHSRFDSCPPHSQRVADRFRAGAGMKGTMTHDTCTCCGAELPIDDLDMIDDELICLQCSGEAEPRQRP